MICYCIKLYEKFTMNTGFDVNRQTDRMIPVTTMYNNVPPLLPIKEYL
jgi:hypothetical protein